MLRNMRISIVGPLFGFLVVHSSGFAQEAPSTFKDCDECPEMVVIPAGSFVIGSPDSELNRVPWEGPQSSVNFDRPFAIGKFEVTFDDWDACAAAGACPVYEMMDRGWGRGRHPVILIGRDDALAYTTWLSERTGQRYRLPSEAEWEYAARGGTSTPFWTGQIITTDQANFDGSHTYNGSEVGQSRGQTLPVGSFPPNPFGLHDLHGNVEEFVADCFSDSYVDIRSDGSARTEGECSRWTRRGGSFKTRPAAARSASRARVREHYPKDTFGFRVARDVEQ